MHVQNEYYQKNWIILNYTASCKMNHSDHEEETNKEEENNDTGKKDKEKRKEEKKQKEMEKEVLVVVVDEEEGKVEEGELWKEEETVWPSEGDVAQVIVQYKVCIKYLNCA